MHCNKSKNGNKPTRRKAVNIPTIKLELSLRTYLGNSHIARVFSPAGAEIATFEIIVHRYGGAYMGRQISGKLAPAAGVKFVHKQAAEMLNEPTRPRSRRQFRSQPQRS